MYIHIAEEESTAIDLTTGVNVLRPKRRLTEFIFHNEDGEPQPVEMMEFKDMFISGLILPLKETSDKEKETGVQCNGFGQIESLAISGYDDGSPVIRVSTNIADYVCLKPAAVYKKLYGQFYEKARASIEIYRRLSISSGGHPDLTLDELLDAVLHSMSGSKNFPTGSSMKELVLSWGEFIYEQLTGLDGKEFAELPVLVALRDESKRKADDPPSEKALSGEKQNNKSGETSTNPAQATLDKGDLKLARLLQENNDWKTLRQNKRQRDTNSTGKFYIRINEAEIANDYPLPAYYESTTQETDEYLICDCGFEVHNPDTLPRNMLHNWSLYDSDFRLISLEVIPMTPCSDIDVTIFGSGIMTDDDGSGFDLHAESASNPYGTGSEDGIPVFLSAIKEWMIEFGSSMVFITIRTDMGWYRLGKPAKEYAPWYEPVLKTARLSISIITLLKDQNRVSRLTFQEVIKRVAEYEKNHPAYISDHPAVVERYIVVHGQIILQQVSEYSDANIRRSAFVNGLQDKMEERSHTRLVVKKRKLEKKESNLNPRGAMEPIVSKRKAMPATTTRLINRIWGDYYSNYLANEMEEDTHEAKKDGELEEENEEEEIENTTEDRYETEQHNSISKPKESDLVNTETKWEGGVAGRTCAGKPLYKEVIVRGDIVVLSGSVLVETGDSAECQSIYFVEYMYEESDGSKWIHGRLMLRACQTVLGNTGNDREVFLTTKCMDFEVGDIAKPVVVEIRKMLWGHQHRKANANIEKNDKLRAEDRKNKGLSLEYFCKSMYCSEKGAFFCLPTDSMGLGKGVCQSCKINDSENEKELLKLNKSMTSFRYQGTEFHRLDYLYVAPHQFKVDESNTELKAYVVCQFLEIEVSDVSEQDNPEYVTIKVRRFFRPEDLSAENAYSSDIREVYYSDQIVTVPIVAVKGKCEVSRRQDVSVFDGLYIFEHIFFCDHQYDPRSGELKQLPIHVKLSGSKKKVVNDATSQKKRRKLVKQKAVSDSTGKQQDADPKECLATLDIFAGCGGLSEGLQKSGASITKWAIEYEEPTGEAFHLNHPDALTVVNNCNVILRAIMTASGDEDDCNSTYDAAEMATKLDETELKKLPKPGQVDFINGGPPCQGFSGMNRFNQSTWSKVQCEMILAFLSFVEYFRPKFFLLENVRNFVSFNKGQTFRLTLASLLAMGYQVRFGILEAGAYGVSQSHKRAFIWAASPEEILPEWPEPMHVFAGPELKIPLRKGVHYAAARSTASGAPYRAITVKDTIGDLPAVGNGASETAMKYKCQPVSWFQKRIRGDSMVLTDHISKEMNELNHMRCQRIPKHPGADWRDLPVEKVRLTSGQIVDLIPWCLPNTAERHDQWKGLFGRLDWEGNFPTSVTDPQPMGKVGMCFHPDQDRILTVRECARSQGFCDSYKFAGNIHNKHRQIGNAVPPPLAFALGRKLKEAIDNKSTSANETEAAAEDEKNDLPTQMDEVDIYLPQIEPHIINDTYPLMVTDKADHSLPDDHLFLPLQKIAPAEMEMADMTPDDDVLIKFYNKLIPTDAQIARREKVMGKIQRTVRQVLKDALCVVYGSSACNLMLKKSDLDFSINIPWNGDVVRLLERISDVMQKERGFIIDKIKYVGGRHVLFGACYGIRFDATINNVDSPRSSTFINSVVKYSSTLRQLLLLVKWYFKSHELNSGSSGSFSSVGISFMVIFFLQRECIIPCFLKSKFPKSADDFRKEARGFEKIQKLPLSVGLSSLLRGFFTFYVKFDFKTHAISLRDNDVVKKSILKWHGQRFCLAIIDPFTQGMELETVGSGMTSYGLGQMEKAFLLAHETLETGHSPVEIF